MSVNMNVKNLPELKLLKSQKIVISENLLQKFLITTSCVRTK